MLPYIFVVGAFLCRYLLAAKPFHCSGGSVNFVAHPVDTLLYMNPDLFHDLWVHKCTIPVVFTSSDRGAAGNASRTLERGLEDAYAFMIGDGEPDDELLWKSTDVQLNGKVVLLRSLKNVPNIQILFLRIPTGTPDGQAYVANYGESLKRLYQKQIKAIGTIDGSARYTLDSLKDLVTTILQKAQPRDVRVLDFKAQVPNDKEKDCDHADHSVSARLVAEVLKRDNFRGGLLGYATRSMLNGDPTLDAPNAQVKIDTYLRYAEYDKAMCTDHQKYLDIAEQMTAKGVMDDVDIKYVVHWMEREYYVV